LAGRRAGGHGLEGVIEVVDVVRIQVAAGCGRAGRRIGHAAGLDHAARTLPGDQRGIVAAGDADRDDLRRAVRALDGEAVAGALAVVERLHRRVAVVEREGPLALHVDTPGAVAIG